MISSVRKLLQGLAGMLWPGKRSFSQYGEDVFIRRHFAGREAGTWLDVGAFHPRIASNTHVLRRQGWRGINVDADPAKIRLFRWFRRHDVNVCAAVAGADVSRVVLERPSKGSYGSMDHVRVVDGGEGVEAVTVAEILASAGVASVDLVSLDVEGMEADILRAFPFDKIDVELFCVEILVAEIEGVLSSPVTEILRQRGYDVVGWHPPSVFYARAGVPFGDA